MSRGAKIGLAVGFMLAGAGGFLDMTAHNQSGVALIFGASAWFLRGVFDTIFFEIKDIT
jgi:hypothetical protein